VREVKIYFAASIRGGRDDWASYLEIVRQLRQYGEVLTEHIGDSELSAAGEGTSDRNIHDRDLGWLKSSDCLGVGYEVGKATEWGKPVLCLYRPAEGRSLSAMIAGSEGVTLKDYQSANELNQIFEHYFRSR
jgi:hypothetical protein